MISYISFEEMGLAPVELNGTTANIARALVINAACDYLMREYFSGQDEDDCLFHVKHWNVDFVTGRVHCDTARPAYKPFH